MTNAVKCVLGCIPIAAVAAALILLPSSAIRADQIDDLERQAAAWISDAKAIYRLDCDAKKLIWRAYCGKLDPENSGEYDIGFARDISRQLQEDQRSKIQPLLERFKTLKEIAENLKRNSETESRANRALEEMQKEADKLEKLKDDLVWRGADHPFTQYAIEYGKAKHRDLCSSISGKVKVCDKGFGGTLRPDLVLVDSDGLWIYEFKADYREAIDEGEGQLRDYVQRVQDYYQAYFEFEGDKIVRFKGEPDSDHGGRAFLEALRDEPKCWDGTRLRAKTKVVPYYMCEERYRCVD